MTSVRDTEVPEPLDGIIGTMHECAGLGTRLSLDIADRFVDEAYYAGVEAGRKAAFAAAVEECQAYASGLVEREDTLTETERVITQGDAAKHLAMRIAQRAKR